jgi:ubiquinone/menaquinone biosynthesis C-methylase UbiE
VSVRSHLAVSPAAYDRRIRGLIPLYDELVAEAAQALAYATRPIRQIVDLGIGTGALARACFAQAPRARVWGIDADAAMAAVARVRLRRLASRLTIVSGSFTETAIPRADALVASYALHHIRSRAKKQRFYRRCRRALRPGGVLITGDCFPASTARGHAQDLEVWMRHLTRTFGSRARAKKVYDSWADEDVYVPLAAEVRMLERAGFAVDVPWRRSPFAVIVGHRHSR